MCALGGDAAIASADGHGWYIRASVLKRAEHNASPAPADEAGPKPIAKAGGCEFDTQCKGDRVCIAHECLDPAPKAAVSAEAAAAPAPVAPTVAANSPGPVAATPTAPPSAKGKAAPTSTAKTNAPPGKAAAH